MSTTVSSCISDRLRRLVKSTLTMQFDGLGLKNRRQNNKEGKCSQTWASTCIKWTHRMLRTRQHSSLDSKTRDSNSMANVGIWLSFCSNSFIKFDYVYLCDRFNKIFIFFEILNLFYESWALSFLSVTERLILILKDNLLITKNIKHSN